MKKVVFFPFDGENVYFVHVLLNVLNVKTSGYEVIKPTLHIIVDKAVTHP